MNPITLYAQAIEAGVTLHRQGAALGWSDPRGVMTEERKARLLASESDLLRLADMANRRCWTTRLENGAAVVIQTQRVPERIVVALNRDGVN